MNWIIQLGILAAGLVLTSLLAAYQLGKRKPPPPDQFQNPKTATGQPIPVLYGTWRVRPIVVWFGGVIPHDIKTSQEFLLGLVSKSMVTGHMYGVTLQGVLCWGAVDHVENMVFGDKVLLSDQAIVQHSQDETSLDTRNGIVVGQFVRFNGTAPSLGGSGFATSQFFFPNLYGGYGSGGGVRGEITLIAGTLQQPASVVLEDFMGAGNVPSYGDLVTVIYHDLIVGETPVPPAIDYVMYREPRPEFAIPGGSGSPQTNPRYLTHAYYGFAWLMMDLNAAAIIYDVLRNPLYGLGFSPDQIDGAGVGISNGLSGHFEDAQRGLVAEGLGMSMLCGGAGEQTTAQAVIDECLRTADAVLLRDPATFQWKLRLIRNEAPTTEAFDALRSFDESHGLKDLEWNVPGLRATINQVTVEFSDAERIFKTNTVTLRNGANAAMTGSIRKKTVQYLAVTDIGVAERLCARDLKASSLPLATGTAIFDRSAFDAERGDVIKLSFSKHGLVDRLVRVLSVDLGDPNDPQISADVVEDVFQFDDFVFDRITAPPGGFPTFQRIIPPRIISASLTRTAGVGSLTFTILDPEHRIVEVADRTKVADAAVSGWNIVATASPDTTDLSFPFNDHVTDGDLNGDVVVTVSLPAGVDGVIEARLTYVGYATIDDPTSDNRIVQQVFVFPAVASSTSDLNGASNPIIWDVTGKSDDSASVTIPGDRTLSIVGAEPGFRGRILINSTGAGGYTFTLPDESIIGDGSSLNVTLMQRDQLSVYWDGSHYWWTHDTSANRPAITFEAALSGSASVTANLQIGHALAASLSASASLTAELTVPINLAASLSASASLTADLAVGSASGFVWKRAITIDHTKCGASDTTNVRVPVRETIAALATVANGGKVNDANGYDIGFYAESALTTKLDWETELYVAATGEVLYWVKVPNVSHTVDTVFYMAYTHPTISTDQSNKTGVWGANAQSVLHFGDGTTLSVADSSVKNEHWNTNGPPTAGTGKLRGGMVSTAEFTYSDSDMPSTGWTNLTGRLWFKPSSVAGAEHGIFSQGSNTSPSFLIQINGATLKFYVDGGYRELSQTLLTGTWYLVGFTLSVVAGTATWRFFKNGAFLSQYVGGTANFGSTNNNLGVATGYNGQPPGTYDEARLLLETYSDDKMLTEYNAENDPSTFESIGAEEAA